MSTYQIAIRATSAAFQGSSARDLYERFLGWWVSLYASPPRKLRRMI
jgi:hypothetical protein